MNSTVLIDTTVVNPVDANVDETSLHPAIFFLMWLNILITGGGNLITIIAFLSSPEIRSKPANIYILNLALADTKVGVISLPFFNLWWHLGTWTFGEVACKFWLIVDYTTVTQSMIAIILISWDRYWMVSRITTYRHKQTTRLAATIIATTWTFWYIYYILIVIFGEQVVGDVAAIDYNNDCDMHINHLLNYTLYEIIGLFFVPLLIISYLNINTFIHVRRRLNKSNEASRRNHKAAVTLAVLVLAYLVCWLPYHIVLLMETVEEGIVPYSVVAFVEYLLWLNSTVNPFVYVCTNPLFRRQLTKMFCRRQLARKNLETNTSGGTRSTILATISNTADPLSSDKGMSYHGPGVSEDQSVSSFRL